MPLSIRAVLRLEAYKLGSGASGCEVKIEIVREAVRVFLAKPVCLIVPTARLLLWIGICRYSMLQKCNKDTYNIKV